MRITSFKITLKLLSGFLKRDGGLLHIGARIRQSLALTINASVKFTMFKKVPLPGGITRRNCRKQAREQNLHDVKRLRFLKKCMAT